VEVDWAYTEEGTVERDAPDWNPLGYRRRGRPRETWRRTVIRELEEKGKNWSEIKELARNRIGWRHFVDDYAPDRSNRNKKKEINKLAEEMFASGMVKNDNSYLSAGIFLHPLNIPTVKIKRAFLMFHLSSNRFKN
jgi:hypothetical protein